MKRLVTIFLAFSLIAVLATISFAQELSQFGVKAGLNRPSMRGDEVERVKLIHKNEMIAGGFVTIGLNETFAIQPEVYYVKKGGDRERISALYDVTLTYVDIPILLRYNVQNDSKLKPCFFIGPMLSFNLDGEYTIADYDQGVDDWESFDFGLTWGAGVDMEFFEFGKIVLDLRYSIGFMNVSEAVATTKQKNQQLTILVGFSFVR